jgi:hypothetical protein
MTISKTSATTQSVANTAKRVIVIVGVALALGESLEPIKLLGCSTVVGSAGSDDKVALLESLGIVAFNYKTEDTLDALSRLCPTGVDIYFDNVGGSVLEATLALMNEKGRIACCGAISQYDSANPTGPRNLPGALVVKRLRMEGFIVMDFADDDAKAIRALQTWVANGQIKVTEDIVDGLENSPAALIGLLAGDNKGKRMVRVGADPSN